MNEKQRLNRKIVGIIIFIIGMLIIFMFGCTPKAACPTYDSAIKVKQQKKKSSFNAWNSDFCVVKPKKSKF